jgi:VIT1/CCC1 family predicted Fe2+/Mn2+ transporter
MKEKHLSGRAGWLRAAVLGAATAALSLISLAGLGAFGGHLGGAPLGRAALRVTIGGVLAMAVTAAIGRIFGVAMG